MAELKSAEEYEAILKLAGAANYLGAQFNGGGVDLDTAYDAVKILTAKIKEI